MNLLGLPWIGWLYTQPQRSHQIAWFVYEWIEREHVLNVTACADWWTRAIGISADRSKASRRGLGISLQQVEPPALTNEGDRAKTSRYRSPLQTRTLS